MRKQEFLAELAAGLSALPRDDMEERLTFYSEMIDDRMEEGLSEEQAVAEIGTVEEVVARIVAETPLSRLVREKVKPKRTLGVWEVVLLVLGSPIWLSLAIAALAVIFAAYVVVWAFVVAMWALAISLAACFLGGMISSAAFWFQANSPAGAAMFGAGIFCAGLTILLFFGCRDLTKGSLWLSKKAVLGIKSLFFGKGNGQ